MLLPQPQSAHDVFIATPVGMAVQQHLPVFTFIDGEGRLVVAPMGRARGTIPAPRTAMLKAAQDVGELERISHASPRFPCARQHDSICMSQDFRLS
jgi:hypothetical protein